MGRLSVALLAEFLVATKEKKAENTPLTGNRK